MNQQKPNNPSTPERDHSSPEKDSAATSGGSVRSYECTFCKRGFTNAQALGGHMNIHRKDKKIKSKLIGGKQKNNIDHDHLTRFPQLDPSGHGVFGGRVNYEVYFTSSNHCIQTRDYFPVWRPEDPIGVRPRVEDGADVDLELRLGQYP